MSTITLDQSRQGLGGFPAGYEPIGRDDLGDTLAVDAAGKIWSFPHGNGDWKQKTLAFETVEQLEAYVAFQSNFEIPHDAGIDALRERKQRIEEFARQQRGARYTRHVVSQVLDDLREEIADRRFSSSRRGKGIAARQAVGQLCEQALRDAGVPGEWMVRAHVDQERALVVMGTFVEPWTEARVSALLQPVVGNHYVLVCRGRPEPRT